MRNWFGFVFLVMGVWFAGALTQGQVEAMETSPEITATKAVQNFSEKSEIQPNELIVKFADSLSAKQKQNILDSLNVDHLSYLDQVGFSLVKVPTGTNANTQEIAKKLLNQKGIIFVEPNYHMANTYTPTEPSSSKQWYLNKIQMPKAWDQTKGSSQITVAVIDSGVQKNHPEFSGKIVNPYNVINGSTSYTSQNHGTHVAGIIAASINKKGITGIAPNIKIMPVNVFSGELADTYDVAQAIYYAADHHANVINLSLGSSYYSYLLDSAVSYAHSKGVVLIAAAGNSDTNEYYYPAALDNVIAVSATDSHDHITSFSNYGEYIDIAAPGQSIYSTVTGSSYSNMSGTSMASPVVSGIAALMLSENPFLTPAQVESILTKSTVDLGDKGWDPFYGYGRIDAYKALKNTPTAISAITANSTFALTGKSKQGISFSIYKGNYASVYIQDAKGTTIRSLVKSKKWTSSKVTSSWDGKRDGGALVGSGTYKIVARLSNGREAVYKTKTIKVEDKVTPSVTTITSTVAFSPLVKGKGYIPVTLNKKAIVTAVVNDSKGSMVKTLWNNKNLYGGKYTLSWDGKNNNGTTMKDGTYKLVLSVRDDKNRKGATKTVPIRIDTVAPSMYPALYSLLYKMDGKTVTNTRIEPKETVSITGYIQTDKGTKVKKLFTNKAYKSGSYNVSWNGTNDKNDAVNEGSYQYYFEVSDTTGNKTILKSSIFAVQDWRKPSVKTDANLYFKEKGSMDIPYTISKAGKVTLEIYKETLLVKTLLLNSDQVAGTKKAVWDGKDEAGLDVADGSYQVKMKVIDKYNQSGTTTSNLSVLLEKLVIEYPSVVSLYQYTEDVVSEVYYKLSQPARVTAEIYNTSNSKLKTIMKEKSVQAGVNMFTWDGTNDAGDSIYDNSDIYIITATNEIGNKTIVKGKINNEDEPSWLETLDVNFTPDDQNPLNNKSMRLTIKTTEQIEAFLYVCDDYDLKNIIDQKEYSLANGENTFSYSKPNTDDLYYVLKFKDLLGNEHVYAIDEYKF